MPSHDKSDAAPDMPASSPLPPWLCYGVAIIGLATMAAIGWAAYFRRNPFGTVGFGAACGKLSGVTHTGVVILIGTGAPMS